MSLEAIDVRFKAFIFFFMGKSTCEALKMCYRANTATTEACNISPFQAYKGQKIKMKGVIEDDECE